MAIDPITGVNTPTPPSPTRSRALYGGPVSRPPVSLYQKWQELVSQGAFKNWPYNPWGNRAPGGTVATTPPPATTGSNAPGANVDAGVGVGGYGAGPGTRPVVPLEQRVHMGQVGLFGGGPGPSANDVLYDHMPGELPDDPAAGWQWPARAGMANVISIPPWWQHMTNLATGTPPTTTPPATTPPPAVTPPPTPQPPIGPPPPNYYGWDLTHPANRQAYMSAQAAGIPSQYINQFMRGYLGG